MYIPPKELRKKYHVKGCFYNIDFGNKIVKCRSRLEIYRNDINTKNLVPNAFFIMMNPGSAEPKSKRITEIPLYNYSSLDLLVSIFRTPLCNAKPDTTQYQVMRLMDYYKWSYVRVFNLSDIRNPKNSAFLKEHKTLNNSVVSIFSDEREEERLFFANGIERQPLVLAWGVNPGLKNLAVNALKKLPLTAKGLQGKQTYQFYHPLPRGKSREWLVNFIKQVNF